MPRLKPILKPEDLVGRVAVANRFWYGIEKKTEIVIEKYDPRKRVYTVAIHGLRKRHAVPLLDMNRHFDLKPLTQEPDDVQIHATGGAAR